MKGLRCLLLLGFFLLFLPSRAGAQFPTLSLYKQISGLSFPVHITHTGDGSGRLFIVEQPGRIRVVKNGVLLATPFLDISSTGANRVLFGGEQGLLSVAFPPGFNAKGYFYVYYTNLNGDNVAARYFLTANPDVADPNSEVILQTFLHPTFANHNGGQLAFGPDSFLYIGIGDGGSGGDPNNNGQNPSTFLGKILRIDVESVANPRIDTYVIPPSNPFVATQGSLPEIWALGLRNPFRFSFDRLTGDLYIGDVGQNLFEEVDFQPAASPGGQNYGWSIMEGFHCFNKLDFNNPLSTCNQAGLTLPVVEYDHTQGDCAVIGGFVYRGNLHPQMGGIYFYGDECTGRIRGLKRNGAVWQNRLLLDSPFTITSFGEDEAGELYLADYGIGDVYRITASVTGDFDGDGKTDIAIYRSSTGLWVIVPSSGAAPYGVGWGAPGDIPVPGDYDGDGKTDVAVYRPSNGWWIIVPSSNPSAPYLVGWGAPGDIPVPGDYDGDGKTDVAVYQSSNGWWIIVPSSNPSAPYLVGWGATGDIPVPGDYDGDGKTDVAVYRPSNGWWIIVPSSSPSAPYLVGWGAANDIPVPGDYDRDGKTDVAVYRPSNGAWIIVPSSNPSVPYLVGWGGDPSDIPVTTNPALTM
jgi:glucose/arabinose dehydrogenase